MTKNDCRKCAHCRDVLSGVSIRRADPSTGGDKRGVVHLVPWALVVADYCTAFRKKPKGTA